MNLNRALGLLVVAPFLGACPPSNSNTDGGAGTNDGGATSSSGSQGGSSSGTATSQGGSSNAGSMTNSTSRASSQGGSSASVPASSGSQASSNSGSQGGSSSSSGGAGMCPVFDSGNANHVAVGRASAGPAVLQADTTWTADNTYFIIGTLEVQGCTLTIQAGTRVCLDAGSGSPPSLDIRPAGGGAGPAGLIVSGTAGSPVVFAPATAGSSWNTIVVSPDSTASLDHLTIRGGGSGGAGVLIVPAGFVGPLHATGVVIDGARGMALSLDNLGGLAADASIQIVTLQEGSFTSPILRASFHAASTLTPTNLVLGAGVPASFRWIALSDNVVSTSVTLPGDLGLPYVINGDLDVARDTPTDPIPTLTLEAGVELLFEGGELRVGSTSGLDSDGANLVADGTAANPVRFSSAAATPAAGDWGGLVIYPGSFEPGVTVLRNVVIDYAGGGFTGGVLYCGLAATPLQGGIRLSYTGGDPTYDGPTLEAVEINDSAGDGLAFTCLMTRCLATDYSAELSGTNIAGELLRANSCP